MAATARSRPDSPSARILAVLAGAARLHAASVSTLSERLGLPVATTHRICSEMERLGYLQRVPGTRLWTVAHGLVALGADALTAAAGSLTATAILRELTERTGEMSSFAVQSGDEVLYVASVESPHAVTLSFRAGRRAPLFCTSSGRLFLARLDDAAVGRYLSSMRRRAFTRHTVTDARKLGAIVRRVRRQGYAITSQEYVLHVVGAAVPVVGADGTFFGAMSIAAPDVRAGKSAMRRQLPSLETAAARLAQALSHAAGGSRGKPGRMNEILDRSTA